MAAASILARCTSTESTAAMGGAAVAQAVRLEWPL